ncbi:MAG: glycosyltransferase family 4 protein [Proteobacteria bacterium]|nr:glycosyltransferase family 4 protein [Pseudomonadota bacterium]
MAETPRRPADALPEDFTLLQVTPALDGGGVEEATLDLAAAVAASGRGSWVASRGGVLEPRLAAAGGRLARMPAHSKNPLTQAINVLRLESLIRRERVSLVHVRSRAPAFSALAAARRAGVPVAATYHGAYRAEGALKRWYNAVMTRGDVVIANSRFTRDHIAAEHGLDPDRIALAPEGVDTDRFDPAAVSPGRVAAIRQAWGLRAPETRAVVLLAGRLTRLKGQRLLVEAVGRLPHNEDVVVILAGDGGGGDYRDEILGAAAVAGLSESVRLVGPCDDMPAAYLAADLVVAPSTQPETFGRTVVEAAAMERPVLAAAHGGPAETVAEGETGWLVAPNDGDAWTAALAAALASPLDQRQAMGERARRRAMRLYSLPAMCEATFNIYRRMLEGQA